MPSKDAHIAAAKRNGATVNYLLQDGDNHLPWIAAITFYQALHIIEAVLDGDPACSTSHTDDHKTRNRLLKTTNRYSHFWKMYRPLWEASLIGRYLRENEAAPTYDVFEKEQRSRPFSLAIISNKLRKRPIRYLVTLTGRRKRLT